MVVPPQQIYEENKPQYHKLIFKDQILDIFCNSLKLRRVMTKIVGHECNYFHPGLVKLFELSPQLRRVRQGHQVAPVPLNVVLVEFE